MAIIKAKKEIDLTKNAATTLADEDKDVEITNAGLMAERVNSQDTRYGQWFKYGKTHAKVHGKYFKMSILPIDYIFQEGLKTYILDEHYDEIMRTLDKEYRAEGEPYGQDPFAQEAAGTADTSNYING